MKNLERNSEILKTTVQDDRERGGIRRPEPLRHPEFISGSTLGQREILKPVQDDRGKNRVRHPELVSGSTSDHRERHVC